MATTKKSATQEERAFAALSYMWVLVLVPILLKRESEFCQFHAKQGLVLFIGSLGVLVVGMFPFIGWFLVLIPGLLIIALMSLLGIQSSLAGKKGEIPYISKYAKKIHL
jgi:fumarate reductase subunit D